MSYRNHDTNQIFAFIVDFMRDSRGTPPTYRQIGDHFSASSSTIAYQLRKLESAGMIALGERTSRHIEVVGSRWVYDGPMAVDLEQYSGVAVAGA